MTEETTEQALEETTEQAPEQTLEAAPEQTPEETPEAAPEETPELTPEEAEKKLFAKIGSKIAKKLGEKHKRPVWLIHRIVELEGVEKALALLEKTLEIEASGGMMVNSGKRRRTPGGIFFKLARDQATGKLIEVLRPEWQQKKARLAEIKQRRREEMLAQGIEPNPAQPPPQPPVNLKKIDALNAELEDYGRATSMKITLIGRPGKLQVESHLVTTHMTHQAKTATFPKGVPPLPEQPTEYTVYIGAKQWKKVEDAIASPEDMLIVEGIVAFNPAINGMAVYAQSVTTKTLQKRSKGGDADQAAPEDEANAPAAESPAAPAQAKPAAPPAPVKAKPAAPPAPPAPPVLSALPADAENQVSALTQALAEAEARVAAINALPFSQRKGLVEAIRAVEDLKRQIAEARQGR